MHGDVLGGGCKVGESSSQLLCHSVHLKEEGIYEMRSRQVSGWLASVLL